MLKAEGKAKGKGKGKGRAREEEEEEEMEEEEEKTEEEEMEEEAEKDGGKGAGKSPSKTRPGKASSSVGTKRKRDSEGKAGVSLRPRSKRPSYVEISSDAEAEEDDDDDDDDDDEDEGEETVATPSPKRARVASGGKVEVVMAGPSKHSKPSPVKTKKPTLPSEDEGMPRMAPDTHRRSSDEPPVAEGEAAADQPGASQPTRAMQGLNIAAGNSESNMAAPGTPILVPAAQDPALTPSDLIPAAASIPASQSVLALGSDAPPANTVCATSAPLAVVAVALQTGPASVVAPAAATPISSLATAA
ncbi:hypothetical protein RSAG8_10630, partial [Rhizoctonia solani AG-8 WAC10335]